MVCVGHGSIHHNQGAFFSIKETIPFETNKKSDGNCGSDVISDRNQSQPFLLKDGPDK
jgi:hypothetical protein